MVDWIMAASSVLGALNKGGGAPPGNALSGAPVNVMQDFDFSGFTVGTGSAKVTGAPNNKTTSQGITPTGGVGEGVGLPALIIGGSALLGLLWNR